MMRTRKLLVAAMTLLLLIVAGSVTIGLAAKPLARSMVVAAAKAHGVQLETRHIDLGWGWVRLREVHLGLEGVPGIGATVERATVDLEGLSPSRVELRGLSVSMNGSPADFVVDLGTWVQRYADSLTFPIAADGLKVIWRESPSASPWLTVDGGLVVPVAGGAKVTADDAVVLGVSVGPVGAMWASDLASATLGFGHVDPSAATLRMDVDRATGKAKVALRQGKLAALAAPLGIDLPVGPAVLVEGTAELSLAPTDPANEVRGSVHLRLRGYVPPHPRELDGIVFGDTTTFDTDVRVGANRRTVTLDKSRLTAGAFVLDGGGVIERKDDHATVVMTMAGNIPCTALAKSAAVARLGAQLGAFLGDAAKLALAGSVRVGVKVSADTRKLADAKVQNDVGIGCTLRLP
jgi:hypothetical protein